MQFPGNGRSISYFHLRQFHKSIRLLCFLAFTFAVTVLLSSQNISVLTTDDGLPDELLIGMAEDADGFIWMASQNHLCRFDGHRISEVKFVYNSIRHLYSWDSLHLLLVVDDTCPVLFHVRSHACQLVSDGHFPEFQPTNQLGVSSIHPNGSIWIKRGDGATLYNSHTGHKQSFFAPGFIHGQNIPGGSTLLLQPNGSAWLQIPGADYNNTKWYELYPGRPIREMNPLPFPEYLRNGQFHQINDSLANTIWMDAGQTGCTSLLNFRNFEPTLLAKRVFKSHTPFLMANWMPIEPQIFLLNIDDKCFQIVFKNRSWKLVKNVLNVKVSTDLALRHSTGALFFNIDKGNGINWLGRLSSVSNNFLKNPVFDSLVLALKASGSLIKDGYQVNNTYFISVFGIGMITMDNTKNEFLIHSISSDPETRLIQQIFQYSTDTLWLATAHGLLYFKISTHQAGRLKLPNAPLDLSTNRITRIFQDPGGWIWVGIGGGKGVYRFNPKIRQGQHWPFIGSDGRLPLRYPSAITSDSKGDVWFGCFTGGGIVHWHHDVDTFEVIRSGSKAGKFNESFGQGIQFDHAGRLWFGTEGINCLGWEKPGQVTTWRLGPYNILFNDLWVTPEGQIWLATDKGLGLFTPETGTCKWFSERHGLPGSQIQTIRPWDPAGDTLFIGCNGGYSLMLRKRMGGFFPKSKVYLSRLSINGQDTLLNRPFEETLSLAYNQNDLEIEFCIINMVDGDLNRYWFNLDAPEGEWKSLGSQNLVRLAGLGPGHHVLRLRVEVNGGRFYHSPPWNIDISPPFWKSAWFFLLLSCLLIGLIILFFQMRLKQEKSLRMGLEHLRSQISQDIHDEIGASLTKINLISRLAARMSYANKNLQQKFESINLEARDLSDNLRQITFSLNPAYDHFHSIQSYFREWARQFLENTGIEITFDFAKNEWFNPVVQPNHKRQLFAIWKECLNNAVKHAGASKLHLVLKADHPSGYRMEITDNGKGFSPDQIYQTGNGLPGIKKRAESIRASLEVVSKPGNGVRITVKGQM